MFLFVEHNRFFLLYDVLKNFFHCKLDKIFNANLLIFMLYKILYSLVNFSIG